jgi:hypothetical protein
MSFMRSLLPDNTFYLMKRLEAEYKAKQVSSHLRFTLRNPVSRECAVALPDGRLAFSYDKSSVIEFWSFTRNVARCVEKLDTGSTVQSLTVDHGNLIIGHRDRIRFWNIESRDFRQEINTRQRLRDFTPSIPRERIDTHNNNGGLTITSQGHLFSISEHHSLTLIDLKSGHCLAFFSLNNLLYLLDRDRPLHSLLGQYDMAYETCMVYRLQKGEEKSINISVYDQKTGEFILNLYVSHYPVPCLSATIYPHFSYQNGALGAGVSQIEMKKLHKPLWQPPWREAEESIKKEKVSPWGKKLMALLPDKQHYIYSKYSEHKMEYGLYNMSEEKALHTINDQDTACRINFFVILTDGRAVYFPHPHSLKAESNPQHGVTAGAIYYRCMQDYNAEKEKVFSTVVKNVSDVIQEKTNLSSDPIATISQYAVAPTAGFFSCEQLQEQLEKQHEKEISEDLRNFFMTYN